MVSGKAASLSILIMDTDSFVLLHRLLIAQRLSLACTWSVGVLFLPLLMPIPAFMRLLLVLVFGLVALPIEQLF